MQSADKEQYYPTPPSMVKRMQDRFTKGFGSVEVLEPSCGTGDLLQYQPRYMHEVKTCKADACEVNQDRLSVLAHNKDISVIGHDFLNMRPVKHYGQIIMNPPFRAGVKHLLHAWDILHDGEVVCLLNAASITSPTTQDQLYLARLIEDHGHVEIFDEVFTSEAQRKTNVQVALIFLKKTAEISHSYLDGLTVDTSEREFKPDYVETAGDLAIPNNVIENAVISFNAAKDVLARKVESDAVLTAQYFSYAGNLGGSLLETSSDRTNRIRGREEAMAMVKPEAMAENYNKAISSLKQSAWNYILTGIGFYDDLSVKAKATFTGEFEKVSKLEFTESNIHGFLQGVALNRGAMNDEMMLALFDKFTERYGDNRAYYKSWKSNAKHRTAAWRIKMTRIILPISIHSWCGNQMDYNSERDLIDLDKCMAALDGAKNITEIDGLAEVMKRAKAHGNTSGRQDSEYFEWRAYSETIHLFPKRKDLIDRLNRTVGRLRTWLPEDDNQATLNSGKTTTVTQPLKT